uniref:Ribonuclease H-like domain-containing protein n=1 Tax=Tanacetum cinerariifolium TaxID=118510 RepID=A0A6L2NSF3_TANCI|nr:ribonuclease H-like domain-containing protein [Tanacetum cinerariifolium]
MDRLGMQNHDSNTNEHEIKNMQSKIIFEANKAIFLPGFDASQRTQTNWSQVRDFDDGSAIIASLHLEFSTKDLGSLNYFLGIFVTCDSSGMFLSHHKYAAEILERAHMAICKPSRIPVDTESKLRDDGDPVSDLTFYRRLAGSLKYLTFIRPYISYAVQQVCLYMHDPRKLHLSTFKRILRYVRGTLDHGLHLFSSSTTSLVAYSDANWAGCPTTRRSTSEYRGVANAIAETCWLRNLLYIHFVHDLVAAGLVRVLHIPSRYQYADIFTKRLPSALFEEFRTSLSVRCPPAPTAGEC